MADNICVITYNGVDGACAAAVALLSYPRAEVHITSAARVGRTFDRLSQRQSPPSKIHVCGLGVWCDWSGLEHPARMMREAGTRIHWYCGRGYLDRYRDRFKQFCRPAFYDADTNTEAVARDLQPSPTRAVDRLRKLARHDPNNEAVPAQTEPGEKQQWWMDYIEASVSQYFKYHDIEAYQRAIRNLAEGQVHHPDEQLVRIFRRTGKKYVLRGKSELMRELRRTIRRCAEADEHVLVTGESGVGKEYVAHLLHERSSRAMGPMIPVNCATFAGNEGLANSVLFGHLKGAFTGAISNREGAFVTADSGILFLDEAAELPGVVQPKLLRVLEDGQITPEGADRPRKRVDVRVVAATKQNLAKMVRQGTFRDDLYHRLDTLRIHVPALRRHPEDIPIIAEHSVGKQATEMLSDRAMKTLSNYHWPGNVRQLIKILKRALHLDLSVTEALRREKLYLKEGNDAGEFLPAEPGDIRTIDEVKSLYTQHALRMNNGNKADTARRLDISPNTLKSYIKKADNWNEEHSRA